MSLPDKKPIAPQSGQIVSDPETPPAVSVMPQVTGSSGPSYCVEPEVQGTSGQGKGVNIR